MISIIDQDLKYIELITQSDETAFDSLFRKYYEPLYNFAGRYVRDSQIAENAVQDVFVKIWIQKEKLTIKTNVKAYLFTAVKNHLLNQIKQEKRLSSIEDYSLDLGDDETPESDHLKNETYAAVHKAINELPEQCRKIFKMHRYDNLKYHEIADILGISINTVKTQIKRALKALQKKLEYLSLIIIFLLMK
ncbi:RNA polymerase sigma factor [Bacteroidota bacterium]